MQQVFEHIQDLPQQYGKMQYDDLQTSVKKFMNNKNNNQDNKQKRK
jgi:hypothetical protein